MKTLHFNDTRGNISQNKMPCRLVHASECPYTDRTQPGYIGTDCTNALLCLAEDNIHCFKRKYQRPFLSSAHLQHIHPAAKEGLWAGFTIVHLEIYGLLLIKDRRITSNSAIYHWYNPVEQAKKLDVIRLLYAWGWRYRVDSLNQVLQPEFACGRIPGSYVSPK